MASINQGMFEGKFPNYEVHTTSNEDRLKIAFPNSPIYTGTGTNIEEFTRDGVKAWYEENVLTGEYDPNSDFSSAIVSPGAVSHGVGDYDHSTAPSIPADVQPTEEDAAPGENGSSIVASGKGPNTSTMLAPDGTMNIKGSSMSDPSMPSSPPGSGAGSDVDPSEASKDEDRPLTNPRNPGEGSGVA